MQKLDGDGDKRPGNLDAIVQTAREIVELTLSDLASIRISAAVMCGCCASTITRRVWISLMRECTSLISRALSRPFDAAKFD